MHAVLVLFRPLPNVGIQNFVMWGMYNLAKTYRSIGNPLPIAESRTEKPAMVTLMIHPDCSTVHHHMWIQTGFTVRKRLKWVVTSVTLTSDLWLWSFAWSSLWSLVITPENFMMIQWWEHSQKGVTYKRTDRRTDRQTEPSIELLGRS